MELKNTKFLVAFSFQYANDILLFGHDNSFRGNKLKTGAQAIQTAIDLQIIFKKQNQPRGTNSDSQSHHLPPSHLEIHCSQRLAELFYLTTFSLLVEFSALKIKDNCFLMIRYLFVIWVAQLSALDTWHFPNFLTVASVGLLQTPYVVLPWFRILVRKNILQILYWVY